MLILVGYTVVITNGGFIHFLIFFFLFFSCRDTFVKEMAKESKNDRNDRGLFALCCQFVICSAAFVHILSLYCSSSLVFMKEDSHEVFNNKIILSHSMEVS